MLSIIQKVGDGDGNQNIWEYDIVRVISGIKRPASDKRALKELFKFVLFQADKSKCSVSLKSYYAQSEGKVSTIGDRRPLVQKDGEVEILCQM
jgi:hypothetical protein